MREPSKKALILISTFSAISEMCHDVSVKSLFSKLPILVTSQIIRLQTREASTITHSSPLRSRDGLYKFSLTSIKMPFWSRDENRTRGEASHLPPPPSVGEMDRRNQAVRRQLDVNLAPFQPGPLIGPQIYPDLSQQESPRWYASRRIKEPGPAAEPIVRGKVA